MDEKFHIGVYKDEYGEKFDLYYRKGLYLNGRTSLMLYCKTKEDGLEVFEDYAIVTVNLPEQSIPENLFDDSCGTDQHQDHAFIDHNLTEHLKSWLREKNIISHPIRTAHQGFVHFELCEILV